MEMSGRGSTKMLPLTQLNENVWQQLSPGTELIGNISEQKMKC
jgi:hypothetical protein